MSELDDLRRTVQQLADREAIRDVLYSYTRHMDRLHADGVKQGYHPDADDLHWGTFVGNAHEFADFMTGELRNVRFVTHEITNPIIELDGDRAFVESRYTSRVRVGFDGAPAGRWVETLSHGRYLDVFERRDGDWKVAHRRLVQDGSRVELITDLATVNPDGAARPWPDDLVYRGFGILDLAPEPQEPAANRFAALGEFGRRGVAGETQAASGQPSSGGDARQ